MILLPLVLTLTIPPSEAPAVTAKYRIEQRLETRVDLSQFGQPEQVQSQRLVWFTTLTYSDSAGGQVFHAVLDSLQIDFGIVPIPPGSVDSARGSEYHGFLDAWGRVQSLTSLKAGGSFAPLFEGQLRGLHPRRKPSARTGERWIDTLTVDTKTTLGQNRVTTVTTFTQGGAERQAGLPATRLDAIFTATTAGTVETPAGPAEIEGKGSGTATYFTGSDGRLLAGTTMTTGDGSMSMSAAPAPIPLKLNATITITLIK